MAKDMKTSDQCPHITRRSYAITWSINCQHAQGVHFNAYEGEALLQRWSSQSHHVTNVVDVWWRARIFLPTLTCTLFLYVMCIKGKKLKMM